MATYTVTQGREQKMSFQGSKDSLKVTWHQTYYVDVTGTAAETKDAYGVMSATGVPVVNRSIYTNPDGDIIPFVICRGKTAKQMPGRLSRWIVDTQWEATRKTNSEESDNSPISPPAAITDITPRVVARLGEREEILWVDYSPSPQVVLLPTGNDFLEPLLERVPTLTLEITQYEAGITYEQMLQRKLKCNDSTYRTQDAYKWLIEHVEATEVDVELSGGSTTAALVTYTVTLNDSDHGWEAQMALRDKDYKSGTKLVPFPEGRGYIDSSGGKRGTQEGIPDYINFRAFDTINFNSFLQV